MGLILSCQSIAKSFGARSLFQNISLGISEGERLGLIGPNGAGKSTLLRILAGLDQPDAGTVSTRKQIRVGYVPQIAAFDPAKTIGEILAEMVPKEDPRIAVTLGKAGFADGNTTAGKLSGGWTRRLAIARELVNDPDLIFLDEPTNHLDLDGILWLEKLVENAPFACVIVSHDRYFLDNVVNDMAEIDRAYPEGLLRVEGSYSAFLEKKEAFLAAQARREEALENRVKRELEWLRRGPKARRGKSRARIDAAGRLMDELAAVAARNVTATAQIDFSATERKTKKLLAAESIAKHVPGRKLFAGLTFTLSPGVRLGLVGPNGSGKTTLLRILYDEIEPDRGSIERAEGLRVVYFDQEREQLDPRMTLREGLGAHGDAAGAFVTYRDRPMHVAGWAKRFLFQPEQLGMAVGKLSGGEQARVLIARLMLRPADVLLLDEPTNDLDINTLETLEESLLDFPGALVLVTHDRYLLDRVSTQVLALDGAGGAGFFADYWQWEQAKPPKETRMAKVAARPEPVGAQRRLSYMEAREWDGMEAKVLAAERELELRKQELQHPSVVSDPRKLEETYLRLKAAEDAVERLYARWAELEAKIT